MFQEEKLLIPWPDDKLGQIVVRARFFYKDECGTIGRIGFPYNIDWDYYFAVLHEAAMSTRETGQLKNQMGMVLRQNNVLCLAGKNNHHGRCFGLMIRGHMPQLIPMSSRHYFFLEEYAKGYLTAAIKAGRAVAGRDHVFQLMDD